MLQQIIDRRLAGKNKSIGNRERFLRRYQGQVRDAVRRAVDQRGIREIEKGEDIHLPRRDISEPSFGHGGGGAREIVHPGNREYVRGDHIERPQGGSGRGSGSGQAGDSGEGEDDFVFHLTKEEFMQIFFDDLALPRMTRTQLTEVPEMKSQRAGFSNAGTPSNLSVIRSMRGAIGRRVAIGAGSRVELAAGVPRRLPETRATRPSSSRARISRQDFRLAFAARAHSLPRPIDLRFATGCAADPDRQGGDVLSHGRLGLDGRGEEGPFQALLHPPLPVPDAALREDRPRLHPPPYAGAGGGRGELLPRPRDRRHGGLERPGADGRDHHRTLLAGRLEHLRRAGQRRRQLASRLRPLPRAADREPAAECRYFAYVQVAEEEQNLWEEYARLQETERAFAMRKVTDPSQIYPVFRDLFKSEGAAA